MEDLKELDRKLKEALVKMRNAAYLLIDSMEAQGRLPMRRAEELRQRIDATGRNNGQTKPR